MGKGPLTEAVEYLLRDKHDNVDWGEKIPNITKITKLKNPLLSQIEGKLIIHFDKEVDRSLIEDLLKDNEKTQDGSKGILTKKGYMPDEFYVQIHTKNRITSLFNVNGEQTHMSIFYDPNKGDYVNERALEILEEYLSRI